MYLLIFVSNEIGKEHGALCFTLHPGRGSPGGNTGGVGCEEGRDAGLGVEETEGRYEKSTRAEKLD